MNPNMNPNLNLNMPINNRPVINHQAISPLRQVNQTSNINHIVHPNFPHTQLPSPQPQPHRPQIHY